MKTKSNRPAHGLLIKNFLVLAALFAAVLGTKAEDTQATTRDLPAAKTDNSLPATIDLKPFYSNPFVTGAHTNTTTYLSLVGRRTYDGLPFDIEGRLVMDGQNDKGSPLVEGIKIGRKFEELHLIHTAQWHEYEGCTIALVRLHYADGTSDDLKIQYAVNVTANRLPSEAREILTDPNSKLIWRHPGPFGGDLRLIKTVLNNPSPEKEVASIDLISTHSRASYVLFAATVANHDSQRAVTPPMPLNDPDFHFDSAVKIQVVDAESGAAIVGADVYPWMSIDDVGLVVPPVLTDTNGNAVVEYPAKRVSNMGVRLSKEGYSAVGGNWQGGEIPTSITYRLKERKKLSGILVDSAGKPVAGVKVIGLEANSYLQLNETEIVDQRDDNNTVSTDSDGKFSVCFDADKFSVVASSPAGFALVASDNFKTNHTITLQPWGSVEGTLLHRGQPMTGRELLFSVGDGSTMQNLGTRTPATVDAKGHFLFPHVPTGDIRLMLKEPMVNRGWSSKELQTVEVKAGKTATAKITLDGRDVIGHWQRDASLPAEVILEQGGFYLRPNLTPPPLPKDLDSQEKIQKWYQEWIKTEAGKKFMIAQRQGGQLQIKSDGTLQGEAIPPGKYVLSGNFWGHAGQVAEVPNKEVVIPESSAGKSEVPFDLGEIVIQAVKHLKVGDTAPDFTVKTLDDQPLKLADFRGKYVLLDFWATWCGPCVGETPHMKAAYDAYGSDARFVMISLSLDQSTNLPKKFADKHDLKWIQGFLGDWSKDTVTKDYSVRGIPSIFLIGPDGKIMAQNLRGDGIKSAVGSALGKHP